MTKSKIIMIVSAVLVLGIIGFFVAKSSCDKGGCLHSKAANEKNKEGDCNKFDKSSCTKSCEPEGTFSGISEEDCHTKSTEQLNSEAESFKEMDVFKKISSVKELETGYEFVYQNPTEKLAIDLIDFIKLERKCCPTYDYALFVEANSKTIRYQRFGSAEIKAELKTYLKNIGLVK